jgi:hypothetical protein
MDQFAGEDVSMEEGGKEERKMEEGKMEEGNKKILKHGKSTKGLEFYAVVATGYWRICAGGCGAATGIDTWHCRGLSDSNGSVWIRVLCRWLLCTDARKKIWQ